MVSGESPKGHGVVINVCDITSKMSADEELLLLSADDFIGSISCKMKRKRAERLRMRTLFQRHMIPPHAVIGCDTSLLPHEYFPTRLKACNYCIQELQRVARNNLHMKSRHKLERRKCH